jgi:hypothetical protein
LEPFSVSRNPDEDGFIGVEDSNGPANGIATSSPVGGASTPSTPLPIERAITRKANKRKPSQRVRDIMSSFIQALNDEDDPDVEDDEVLCNAIENCIDPPNYSAAMKTVAAEYWKTAIEDELKSLRPTALGLL